MCHQWREPDVEPGFEGTETATMGGDLFKTIFKMRIHQGPWKKFVEVGALTPTFPTQTLGHALPPRCGFDLRPITAAGSLRSRGRSAQEGAWSLGWFTQPGSGPEMGRDHLKPALCCGRARLKCMW